LPFLKNVLLAQVEQNFMLAEM